MVVLVVDMILVVHSSFPSHESMRGRDGWTDALIAFVAHPETVGVLRQVAVIWILRRVGMPPERDHTACICHEGVCMRRGARLHRPALCIAQPLPEEEGVVGACVPPIDQTQI